MKRTRVFYAASLLLFSVVAQAYEIRLSEQQLQQQLNRQMPLSQRQGMVTLTLSHPKLDLLPSGNRLSLQTNAVIATSIGLQSSGQLTVEGKIRYDKALYSFFIEEPVIRQLDIDGLAPALQPQLTALAQKALTPALTGQPVYTLSDQDVTQAMARMMLQSLTITETEVLLVMSPF
ncbi:MAG: DUF1439 domain-containing protein [Saccharospirillaceae bacterium]|nr:DUF1439 domain-containing protein [Saccharospirillaceae bacterium]MCD8531070.1 DUF1439 domain-containing protein [Saccharospirillaceae bacterium]